MRDVHIHKVTIYPLSITRPHQAYAWLCKHGPMTNELKRRETRIVKVTERDHLRMAGQTALPATGTQSLLKLNHGKGRDCSHRQVKARIISLEGQRQAVINRTVLRHAVALGGKARAIAGLRPPPSPPQRLTISSEPTTRQDQVCP